MGITIVDKFPPSQKKDQSKLALVLSGGAISGGAFKVGGLKALNDYLANKRATEFDIYVGLSAGAFLAAPLAGGIPPEEMLASLDGKSKLFSQLTPYAMYKPNFSEFLSRPLKYLYGHFTFIPGILYDLFLAYPSLKKDFYGHVKTLVLHPNYSNYEQLMTPLLRVMYTTRSIPQLGELLPSGIFDNEPLEEFIRLNMKRNRMTNNFKVLKRMSGKSLYITAMNMDTSERVIFGPDEKNDLSISQAIQASTAVPGFYKPARIKGVDYIDGGVRKTANIDVAFEKGADLVICYNPFRPFNNEIVLEYLREENRYVTKSKRLADWGVGMVLNQVFRTLFHSRLMYAIETYQQDPNFKKDLILIEPKENESEFFELNPLFFWNRAKAATHGFESVCRSIEANFDVMAKLLLKHGILLSRDLVNKDHREFSKHRFDPEHAMEVMEKNPLGTMKPKNLKVVSGGRK